MLSILQNPIKQTNKTKHTHTGNILVPVSCHSYSNCGQQGNYIPHAFTAWQLHALQQEGIYQLV